MKVLVTGAAGYIGSHTLLALLAADHEVVALDNFSNSYPESLDRVEKIAGRAFARHALDLRDGKALDTLLTAWPADAVIHFAGLKAVGESVQRPLAYYDNNVHATITLLGAMEKHGCRRLIFSSSATVYGVPETVPIREDAPLAVTNPYGRTKLISEEIMRDLCVSDSRWRIALLRYFNPVGAHPSGLIGEDPVGVPDNLFPFIGQVGVGRYPALKVFGTDYSTPDGTGVRDFVHVCDLADGHVAALAGLDRLGPAEAINLGTGRGCSVLEAVHLFEAVADRPVKWEAAPRRPGDVAACYADVTRARERLGWSATRSLAEACRDHWRWQQQNPAGYRRT